MLNIINEHGTISVNKEVVAKIASLAASQCYGLVGMASRNKYGMFELLSRQNDFKGIDVLIEGDKIIIEMSVIIQYGTKISTVADNIIDTVKYYVENQTGFQVQKIGVSVQGVRVQK
ncbi:MAG: Asp23/Gls24 family envelope stress response protein [Peptostreptococcaceae bacterium]|nr:Asp23/Gls24 family envelope stress response protein [Peptostreptococcaceae bacterium]